MGVAAARPTNRIETRRQSLIVHLRNYQLLGESGERQQVATSPCAAAVLAEPPPCASTPPATDSPVARLASAVAAATARTAGSCRSSPLPHALPDALPLALPNERLSVPCYSPTAIC